MQTRIPLWAAAFALSPALVPTAAHADPNFQVVMSGLNNPHGLAFGPDGGLYVAEAGTGGPGASLLSGDGSVVSYGATGGVSRYLNGVQSQVMTGLPSLAAQTGLHPGGSAAGLQDLAFGPGGTLYGVIGLGAETSLQAGAGPDFAALVSLDLSTNAVHKIADLGAYESQANPDGAEKASNPYSLAVLPGGGFAVADAGANDVVGVSADGKTLSTLGVFPASPNPLPFGGPTYEAVPTSVKIGPDGDLYVSELTGFPFPAGRADVFRLNPATGVSSVFASGFTNIADMTFGADGSLYVLDLTTNGLASPNGPGSGVLTRVDSVTGAHTTLAGAGLFFPTSLIQGADGAFYISDRGNAAGVGQVLRLSPPAVPEVSPAASLGLLLLLGGLAAASRRRRVVPTP